MRLFLDCEFTQLSAAAKLISLALVAEDGREFYAELLNTWREEGAISRRLMTLRLGWLSNCNV